MRKPRKTREKPLFLASITGGGGGDGYRRTPPRMLPRVPDEPESVEAIREAVRLRDEPESIGPAILDGYAESNELRHSQRHALEIAQQRVTRRHLNTEDRIRDAERRAKHAHRNLTHEFHVLRQMLQRASNGGRKPPQSALGKLERIEADLDGVTLPS